MFCHTRKSSSGVALPSWIKSGPVYVKRHNRNKCDLLVEEAELLEANPHYAHVRLEDGREITVFLRDLAPNPALPTQRHDVTEIWKQTVILKMKRVLYLMMRKLMLKFLLMSLVVILM